MNGPYREAPDYSDKKPWGFYFLCALAGFTIQTTVYFAVSSIMGLRGLRTDVERAQTNRPERRRLTHGQDRALCVRACGSHEFISTVCEWEPHGVRQCRCQCVGDDGYPMRFSIGEDR